MDCQEVIQEEGSIEGEAQGAPTGERGGKGRDRSRSCSLSTDRARRQPSITKWTTPNRRKDEGQGKDEGLEIETAERRESSKGSEDMEDEISRSASSSSSSQVEIVGVQKKNSRTRGMIWKTMSRMRKIVGRQMARWMEAPMKMQMRKSRGG